MRILGSSVLSLLLLPLLLLLPGRLHAQQAPLPAATPPQPARAAGAFQELYEHPDKGREGFKLQWDDASLSFNLLTQVQPALWVQDRALVDNDDPATTEGFRLRRARVGFYGLLHEQLGVNLVLDLRDSLGGGAAAAGSGATASGSMIAAANVVYRPYTVLNLALGTAPLPFSRGAMAPAAKLQLIERPLSITRLAPGSQLGAAAMGSILGGGLDYALGVYNGEQGRYTQGPIGEGLLYAARLQVSPLGRVDPGESDRERSSLGVVLGGDAYHSDDSSVETYAWSGDASLKWRGLSLLAELIADHRTPANVPVLPATLPATTERLAWYAQGGFFVVDRYVELAARYEWVDDQRDLDDAGDVWLLTGGANLFLMDGALKVQLNYVHREERKVPELANDVLFGQVQVSL